MALADARTTVASSTEEEASIYTDSVNIVIQATDTEEGETAGEVLVAQFVEVGMDVDLDAAVPEIERWIVAQGLDVSGYTVETQRNRAHVGAELITGAIVITFILGMASNAAWDGLVHYIQSQILPNERPTDLAAWLRQLDPDDASYFMQAKVARAFDRPRGEFRMREIVRDEERVEATFDSVAGEVYRIRVTPGGYRVSKIG